MQFMRRLALVLAKKRFIICISHQVDDRPTTFCLIQIHQDADSVCLVMLATSCFLARSSILSSPRNLESDCPQSPCSWLPPDVSTHSMKKMEAWYFLSLCSCTSSIFFSRGTVSWMRATNVIYTFITWLYNLSILHFIHSITSTPYILLYIFLIFYSCFNFCIIFCMFWIMSQILIDAWFSFSS